MVIYKASGGKPTERKTMNAMDIHNKLQEAWEISTKADNRFAVAVGSIKWDDMFSCEDGYYFTVGDYTLHTLDMDPFGPCADAVPVSFFGGGMIYFDGVTVEI